MKLFIAICTIFSVGTANCGFISSPTLIRTPAFYSSYVKSDQLGQNYAYSTSQSHQYTGLAPVSPVLQRAVPYVQHVAQPVVSYQAPLSYAVPQQLYTHSVVPQHYYTPSVVSSSLYSGLYGGGAFVAQAPVNAGSFVSGLPSQVFGSLPVQGQAPGQAPSQPAVEEADSSAQNVPQGDSPAPGTTVDDDSVSVESA